MSLDEELQKIDPTEISDITEGVIRRILDPNASEEALRMDEVKKYPALIAIYEAILDTSVSLGFVAEEGEPEENYDYFISGVGAALHILTEYIEITKLKATFPEIS